MKQKTHFTFLIAVLAAVLITSCNRRPEFTTKSPLERALDSAEVLFTYPRAEKIADRIKSQVLAEKNSALKMKGLRILSKVLLSKWVSTSAELDSAAVYVKQAEKLALAARDSMQWALCQLQLFRYENRIRNEYSKPQMGPKARLVSALKIIEKSDLTDELSFAYRVLARRMLTDQEPIWDVLHYDLLSLQYNDSIKYPEIRAAICMTLFLTYSGFGQSEISLEYLLRAKTILQHTDDTVYYAYVTLDLASMTDDNAESLRYYHDALRVLLASPFHSHQAWAYYSLALRFQRMQIYDSAVYYSDLGIAKLSKSAGDKRRETLLRQTALAESYAALHKFRKAKRLAALHDKLTIGDPGWEQGTPAVAKRFDLKLLLSVYVRLNDLENLTRIQAKLIELRRQLYSEELLSEVGKAEKRYQIKLKDEEVESLEKTRSLKAKIAKQERLFRFLLICVVIVAIAGLLKVRVLLIRRIKLHQSLTKQSNFIEQQKIHIESSLLELQQTQAYILNSEKMMMLGQFTAGVAHELNNPLNFVSGGVSVLEDTLENAGFSIVDNEYRILHGIRQGVDSMMAIVSSLRVFINPKSEIGFDSHSEVVECMNASLLVLQSRIRKETIKVVSNIPESLVIGHSGQLCQVFINIINNAIDAVRHLPQERKTIEIMARKNASHLLIDFNDYGVGIPESIQSKLFLPFATTKPNGQGMGLGLFICKAILQDIGGAIAFESKLDCGTRLTIQLLLPR